jgi:RimJ/RimL family protein N-acetyltransferase
MDIFPIRSARLILRRFQEKDLPAFVAYRFDPEIARYQAWSSITDDEAQAFIQTQQHAQFGVPGEWFQVAIALKETETDALIGDMGVCVKAEDRACAEIGFTLSQPNQGKGFASEAVSAMLAVIFEVPGVERIEATADARNTASIALLRRIGMRQAKTEQAWFKGAMCTEYTFVLSKQDWLSGENA